ncbi:MAG: S41 family peptidase [Terriglobales bacterium]
MRASSYKIAAVFVLLGALAMAQAPAAVAKKKDAFTNYDREMLTDMMQTVQQTLLKHYYDPAFHGVDIKARYSTYLQRVETAPNFGVGFREIAAYLAGLNDSHTYFVPPSRSWEFFYGFTMQLIGDRAFIAAVRPSSDAAAKLHPGDEILSLDGYSVNRKDYDPLSYDLYELEPRPTLRLVLRDPVGRERTVSVNTKFVQHSKLDYADQNLAVMIAEQERLEKPREAVAGDVFIWKLPDFVEPEEQIDAMMSKARPHPAVVLDLRGNPGGALEELQYLLGYFLPEETKIADVVGRKHKRPEMAKPHDHPYGGKLVVLVDSGSASAAELFARVVQLNRRGVVVGDQTAGAVMEAEEFPLEVGVDIAALYGMSVTVDDLVMSDGHSLEHVGVTPDVMLTPTAADLAAARDPVLARAVALAGGELTPEAAGKLFPYLWRNYRN